jgi:hypothetical protein
MGGDLEDAVDRGIADRPSGALMLLPQPRDDLRSAGVAVAENAVGPGKAADLVHDVIRKGRVGLGEIAPVPGHRQAGKLPVARRRVLAGTDFLGRAPEADGIGVEPLRPRAGGKPHRRAQTQRIEVRQSQRAGSPLLRRAARAGRRDMAKRVGPGIRQIAVEEPVGIRRAAAAHAVHDHQEGARHQAILSWIRGGGATSEAEIVKAARI